MTELLDDRPNTHLPAEFTAAHSLCLVIHDMMAELIRSGEENNIFNISVKIEDHNTEDLDNGTIHPLDWLEKEGRLEERADLLRVSILPALLSDMMHCIYETLESSRKGKLNISFMLVRKPIQESLYVLEAMLLDQVTFSETLATDPLKLRHQNGGDVDAHSTRIQKVLDIIDLDKRFNADYIAQLRYNKKDDDSFDGICNKAMHLFTSHKAIKTEEMNLNFIFSDEEQKITQWDYLYSRLPYLLDYIHMVVEHIAERIQPTPQDYLDNIQRMKAASILAWWKEVYEEYRNEELRTYVNETYSWLNEHCKSLGCKEITNLDIANMFGTGDLPPAISQ